MCVPLPLQAPPPGFNPLATPLASPGAIQQQQLQQQLQSMYPPAAPTSPGAPAPAADAKGGDPWNSGLVNF